MIEQAVILAERPPRPWRLAELARHGLADLLVLAPGDLARSIDRLAERFFLIEGEDQLDINLWDLALRAEGWPGFLALRAVPETLGRAVVVIEGEEVARLFLEKPGDEPAPGLIAGGVGVFDRAALTPTGPALDALSAAGRLGGHVYDRPMLAAGAPAGPARGAVIFDRDGVLNQDTGYAHRPEQIVWVEGALAAVKAVNDAGLLALVATNQSGVARGLYGEADVQALHHWMNRQMIAAGAHIDAFAYSPFHPDGVVAAYRRDSDCRKPGPRMLLDLMAAHALDPSRVLMVGDGARDLEAAKAAGVEGLLFSGGDLSKVLSPMIARLTA